MSAAAAYQKFLELKNISALPILSDDPILGDIKSNISDEPTFLTERTILIITLLYSLIRVLISLFNWFSRYHYFKTKRPSSTTHAMYYTWFYCTGAGNE